MYLHVYFLLFTFYVSLILFLFYSNIYFSPKCLLFVHNIFNNFILYIFLKILILINTFSLFSLLRCCFSLFLFLLCTCDSTFYSFYSIRRWRRTHLFPPESGTAPGAGPPGRTEPPSPTEPPVRKKNTHITPQPMGTELRRKAFWAMSGKQEKVMKKLQTEPNKRV